MPYYAPGAFKLYRYLWALQQCESTGGFTSWAEEQRRHIYIAWEFKGKLLFIQREELRGLLRQLPTHQGISRMGELAIIFNCT